jgi:hypothetical protein
MSRFPWIVVLCLLAFAALALASTEPSLIKIAPNEVILSPAGHYAGSLDDPQPDSIFYDNGTPAAYYGSADGLWARMRFTAPSAFNLRSVYFACRNSGASTAPCSLIVHAASGANLGAVLARWSVANVPNNSWIDTNLPTPVDIAAGADFYVVLGPQPTTASNGWRFWIDNAPTSNRPMYSFAHTGQTWYTAGGDWLIEVGGDAADFTDLAAQECYDHNADNVPMFHMLAGETLTLGGQIKNTGNVDVAAFNARFIVKGPANTIVYTNDVDGGALARGTTGLYTASEDFTPVDEGEYMAACVAQVTGDAMNGNDTTWLRLEVEPLHNWFRYDDNLAADGYTNFENNAGWGVTFSPVEYAASVESLRVNVSTGTATGGLQIWLNDPATGVPSGEPLWSTTTNLLSGWNTIAVDPPVNLFEGQRFTVLYIYNGRGLGQDNSAPVAANITGMQPAGSEIAWQFITDTWYSDISGNWLIQAYIDTTSALPPWPLISTSVDTLQFGQIVASGDIDTTISLWIYNNGAEQPLTVSMPPTAITPVTIRPAFTILPVSATIETGDSAEIQITFNPFAVRTYPGVLAITNNSHNHSPKNIIIRGEGIAAQAVELPNHSLPTEFSLAQNFPNPFNPTTDIHFSLPTSASVRLTVYNVLGQEIALLVNETLPAGAYRQTFDAARLPAGIYFYRLEAGSFTDIRKMMLLK